MKIEFLYAEVAALFGENGTIKYLQLALPQAEYIFTKFNDEPRFVSEKIDLVYLGPMSEGDQKRIIKRLMKYQSILKNQIEAGNFFLFIGNAVDILGNKIIYEENDEIAGLGIFDFYTKLDYFKRFNCMMLADYHGIQLVGHKTQFGLLYGNNENNYFAKVEKGIGLNKESNLEGFEYKNLIATHIVGPLLLLNPLFTKQYLKRLTNKDIELPFQDTMMKSYERQLINYQDIKASGQ